MGISLSTTYVPSWQNTCASKFNCTSPGLVDILGQPLSFSSDTCAANSNSIPTEVWGITYSVCVQYCGAKVIRQSVQFTQAAITMTTWLLPWISLIAQLPFEAKGWQNFVSGCLAVGSPALASYSIALTAFNRWYISREFRRLKVVQQRNNNPEYEYMIKRIDAAAFILQEVQQCPMRANQSDGQLGCLIALKDEHTERFWEIARKDLSNTRRGFTYSFLAQVLLAFLAYLFSFIAAVHDSLGSPDVGLQFATSTVWSWMFPIVFGYVQVGSQYKAGSIEEALTDNKLIPSGIGESAYQTALCPTADLFVSTVSTTRNPPTPAPNNHAAAGGVPQVIPPTAPPAVAEPGNTTATTSTTVQTGLDAPGENIPLSTFSVTEGKATSVDTKGKGREVSSSHLSSNHASTSHASTSQILPHSSPSTSQLPSSNLAPQSSNVSNTGEDSSYQTESYAPPEDDQDERAPFIPQAQNNSATAIEQTTSDPPTWMGFDVRGDERREGPVFNYARIFTWFEFSQHVLGGFKSVTEKYKRNAAVPSSSDEAAEICGFKPHENLKAFMELKSMRSIVVQHIVGAAAVGLFIQWGTTAAGIFIAYYTPAVGLSCRSGSFLIYGIAATLSGILLVSSNLISHTVMQRLEDTPNNPNTNSKESRGDVGIQFLSFMAVSSHLLGKGLAIANAFWLVAFTVMEDIGTFQTCWCQTDAFQYLRSGWTPVFKSSADLSGVASGIWIGGFIWSISVCLIASAIFASGN